jgi:hypothetical protein
MAPNEQSPQRWSLERAAIRNPAGHGKAAFVQQLSLAPGDAGIVKPLVAEGGADVARRTVRFAAKELQTLLLFQRQRRAVTADESSNGESPESSDRTKLASERDTSSIGMPTRPLTSGSVMSISLGS